MGATAAPRSSPQCPTLLLPLHFAWYCICFARGQGTGIHVRHAPYGDAVPSKHGTSLTFCVRNALQERRRATGRRVPARAGGRSARCLPAAGGCHFGHGGRGCPGRACGPTRSGWRPARAGLAGQRRCQRSSPHRWSGPGSAGGCGLARSRPARGDGAGRRGGGRPVGRATRTLASCPGHTRPCRGRCGRASSARACGGPRTAGGYCCGIG